MIEIPQRSALVVQAADCLRAALARGEWTGHLPGARELSAQMQVSRSTLAHALAILRQEGLIRVAHGRRTTILRRPRRRAAKRDPVVFLSSLLPVQMDGEQHHLLGAISHHLRDAGYPFLLKTDPRLSWQKPAQYLDLLTRQTPSTCWVLSSVDRAVQQWFAERNFPTLVWGTPHPGIRLPAIDTDFETVVDDAMDRFAKMGHHAVALITFQSDIAGHRRIEERFLQRAETAPMIGASASALQHHDRTTDAVCRAVDAILRAAPRPTGLLVVGADWALTVSGYLTARKLSVPRDISILCTNYQPLLSAAFPSIAGYHPKFPVLLACATKRIISLARMGALPARITHIPVVFEPGHSLGPAPHR
jgi:DNA-binding LacI/PurR family transcriptional regulator